MTTETMDNKKNWLTGIGAKSVKPLAVIGLVLLICVGLLAFYQTSDTYDTPYLSGGEVVSTEINMYQSKSWHLFGQPTWRFSSKDFKGYVQMDGKVYLMARLSDSEYVKYYAHTAIDGFEAGERTHFTGEGIKGWLNPDAGRIHIAVTFTADGS